MIGWAATFLIIALLAAVLGFTGIAGIAVQLAWILFVVDWRWQWFSRSVDSGARTSVGVASQDSGIVG